MFAALLFTSTPAWAQADLRDERGSREAERRTLLDANRARLTVFNYGLSGGVGEVRGEWPAGSGDFYLGDMLLVVGAEVEVDTDGDGSPDTTRVNTVTVRGLRAGIDLEGPPGEPGAFWGFEAVPEYQADGADAWARSDDPATWPAAWPEKLGDADDPGWAGAWNGLLGKNAFVDGVELYSHLADDDDHELDYTPDPQDPERGGLGLVVGQRVLAWRDPLLEDAVVYVYDLHNASPKDLPTVAAGHVLGIIIGGDGDSQDDCAGVDFSRDLAYAYDFDNSGSQGQPVGVLGYTQAETPEDLGLTSVFHFAPPGALRMDQDEELWNVMTDEGFTGTSEADCQGSGGVDGDLMASTATFALPAFSERRLVRALVFGGDTTGVAERTDVVRGFVRNGFSFEGGAPVSVLSPSEGDVVWPGSVPVTWEAADGSEDHRVHLAYSRDFGATWTEIVRSTPNDGTYTWGTGGLPGGLYQLRVVAYGPDGVGAATTGLFTLDASGNEPPQVAILSPTAGQPAQGVAEVTYTALDAEGGAVTVDLDYRIGDGAWLPLAEDLPGGAEQTFLWDTAAHPNSDAFYLRAVVSDGTLTGEDEVGPFIVRNPRLELDGEVTFEGVGSGVLDVRVADPSAVTGHTYRVVFTNPGVLSEEPTTYTVTDLTADEVVLEDVPVVEGEEGPLFDGLRLVVFDAENAVDDERSGYVEGGDGVRPLEASVLAIFQLGWQVVGTAVPYDYEVTFSDDLIGESLGGFVLCEGLRAPTAVARPTNFTVRNVTEDRPAEFVLCEVSTLGPVCAPEAQGDGFFEPGDGIFLYEELDGDAGQPEPTYGLHFGLGDGEPPGSGDVFGVVTTKALQTGDAFMFEARLVAGEGGASPDAFRLDAPFPNPAAGQATVAYTLGRPGRVRLALYDLLGRRVHVLMDAAQTAGAYRVRLETAGLATGVYLVRLEAGGRSFARKLAVVR